MEVPVANDQQNNDRDSDFISARIPLTEDDYVGRDSKQFQDLRWLSEYSEGP